MAETEPPVTDYLRTIAGESAAAFYRRAREQDQRDRRGDIARGAALAPGGSGWDIHTGRPKE